ncbi:hypothetical protein EVAR_83105_1 [Eumeta japonica]|uniref:Uncharacterized protein n=1 Tax=Eumeta variegata TaxID=151549 RepID=A0A4C1WQ68_EUMVA|nr:hypothetical protein EVAR_83105_1 [Eumeta japonica]
MEIYHTTHDKRERHNRFAQLLDTTGHDGVLKRSALNVSPTSNHSSMRHFKGQLTSLLIFFPPFVRISSPPTAPRSVAASVHL